MLRTPARSRLRRFFSPRSAGRGSAAFVAATALAAASLIAATPALAAPTNDNFAAAQSLSGPTGQVFGTTVDATGQAGEPTIDGSTPITSIWYNWTAPSAATVSFDTCSSEDFDTLLGVYTGVAVNALTAIVTNDQAGVVCPSTNQSRVSFTPVSGTTYRIKIDGYLGETGLTALTWTTTGVGPANDNFASATTLSGTSGTVSGTTVGATPQTGEPLNDGPGPIRSVWYKITPAATGTLTVDLCAATNFDSVIGVYTGTLVNALTTRGTDDDGCGTFAGPSKITSLSVTGGTTYSISIDGYGGIWSAFSLSYSLGGALPPPVNDNLANAISLPGASGSVTGTTVNATGETNEVRVSGLAAAAKSVWYSWVAPSSGSATFGLCTGTSFDTLLGVYTGTTYPLNTPAVATSDDTCGIQSRVTFNAVAGTSYKIQVDGYTNSTPVTASGPFTLTYGLVVPLTLAIDDVTLSEGDPGATNFAFTVSLSAASASTVTVNYATADGTATTPADYASTSGSLSFTSGQTSKTITVPVVGDVIFEPNETFFVNLTGPSGATLADGQGLGTITNDDSQPAVSIGDLTHTEGDTGTTNFTFPVSLSSPSSTAVTVNFSTADDTATAPTDYTAASGTLVFPAGTTTQSVVVAVQGDTLFESDETFFVNLSGVTGGTLSDNQGVGTISNDDASPTVLLSIDDVTHAEGDTGTTTYTFTVSLSDAASTPVTVDYTSTDGTATAPSDYAPVSGTLTFVTGQTSETITVLVNGDSTYEPAEGFSVDLSNGDGADISDDSGVGIITNDDAAPVYAIDDVTAAEGDTGTTPFVFTVSRTGDTALPSTVQFTTTDGTADSSADFTATSGTLAFLPGDTSATVAVQVTGDLIVELNETFTVDLANATNATIGDGLGVGTMTNDDTGTGCTITGTPGNDTLTGTAGVDVICGGDGNDIIRGLGGNDTLRGEGGSDTIVGGAGNDVIDGGAGSDTVAFDTDPAGVTVNLGAGTATDGYGNSDTLTSFTTVSGSPFNDKLIGTTAADKLYGQAGADKLGGLGGNDVLNGGGGADRGDAGGGTDQCVSVEQSVNCEPAAAEAESGVLGLSSLLGTAQG